MEEIGTTLMVESVYHSRVMDWEKEKNVHIRAMAVAQIETAIIASSSSSSLSLLPCYSMPCHTVHTPSSTYAAFAEIYLKTH